MVVAEEGHWMVTRSTKHNWIHKERVLLLIDSKTGNGKQKKNRKITKTHGKKKLTMSDRVLCSTIFLKHIRLLLRVFETSTDACFPG